MQIGELAKKGVVTARPHETVRHAILTIETLDVRHLPIVDDDGGLIGIVSDRDLREYRIPIMEEIENPEKASELLETAISEVMSGDVVSIGASESVRTAADLMIEYGVGALPVLDPDSEELVGIVSYVDLLRIARDSL